jgi:hypothetical protein
MTFVPERLMFVSVDADGSDREIQLQRAARPRPIEGDSQPLAIVRPRTVFRREGLDLASPAPYPLFEEEVPPVGALRHAERLRTRWVDRTVFLWLNAPLSARTSHGVERPCIRPGGGDAAGGVT